jgi:hypothetical protein
MPVEALRKQWGARNASAPLHPLMTFEGDALVLGAGTKLAVAESGSHRGERGASAANDAHVVALLSAAYRRPIEPAMLTHIRRALVKQNEGEAALALIHLALTGLPRLANPEEDARRLFMADGLIKAGVARRVILQALELDPARLDDLERRYNPDQPRVPAGNGRQSGQWTDGSADRADGSSATSGQTNPRGQYAQNFESDAERISTEPEKESERVTFFNPVTGQTISFPANSALEPRAPTGFINLNDLPRGETYLQPPPSETRPQPGAPEPEIPPPSGPVAQPSRTAQLAINRAAGAAWEVCTEDQSIEEGLLVGRQVTIVTASGTYYRADHLTLDPNTSVIGIVEAKASQTAPLTPNQSLAVPEIAQTGGTIVGVGKPGFPGRTQIPPTTVRIVRPPTEKSMTIEQPDVIDFTTTDPLTGEVCLVISDHLPFDVDEGQHLWILQCKINKYLGAVESGEIYQQCPQAIGNKIVIFIAAKHPLTKNARSFIEKCRETISGFGLELRVDNRGPGSRVKSTLANGSSDGEVEYKH